MMGDGRDTTRDPLYPTFSLYKMSVHLVYEQSPSSTRLFPRSAQSVGSMKSHYEDLSAFVSLLSSEYSSSNLGQSPYPFKRLFIPRT